MAESTSTAVAAPAGAIEVRSIDYVPESERHGRVWMQGPFWFLGNFQPFTVAIGFVGPSLGLSFGYTVLASVLGILFGTLFMAAHASQGPKLGLPQMIQSRAQFGYRGVVLPLVATLFTFEGFNVVDTVIIKNGLKSVFGWNDVAVAAVISLVAGLLAIYGHDWLHRVFQVLFWVSLPFWVVLTVGILAGHAGGHPTVGVGTFTWVAFFAQFTVAASYNITYAPYVSDYSRYLPRNTPSRSIILSVFTGAAASPIWLIPIGAWMAIALKASDPIGAINSAGNAVVHDLGGILTVLSVLALVATMGLNAYSGMLTVVTGIDAVRPVRPTRSLRVVTIAVLVIGSFVLGLALSNATSALNNALLIMLYLLAPWTAVNLVDFFLVRHGHYAITDLFTPEGIYGRWGWRGVTCYLVGIAVELPFMVLTFYTGFVAKHIGSVDISFIVGMAVSGLLYLVLTRGMDVSAEEPAIEASEQVLATTGVAR